MLTLYISGAGSYLAVNIHTFIYKQSRQYTYIVTLSRVLATVVAIEKQQILHIVSVNL